MSDANGVQGGQGSLEVLDVTTTQLRKDTKPEKLQPIADEIVFGSKGGENEPGNNVIEGSSDVDSSDSDDSLQEILAVFRSHKKKSSKRMKEFQRQIVQMKKKIHWLETQSTIMGERMNKLSLPSTENMNSMGEKDLVADKIQKRGGSASGKLMCTPTRRVSIQSELDSDVQSEPIDSISPLINHQLWEEFQDEPSRYVIDVLLGEPQAPPLRKQRNKVSWEEQYEQLDKAIEDMKGKAIPERIRVNSALVYSAIKRFLNIASPSQHLCAAEGWVVLRPFKPLLRFEANITPYLLDLSESLRYVYNRETNATSNEERSTQIEPSIAMDRMMLDNNVWRAFLTEHEMYCCENCVDTIRAECLTVNHCKRLFAAMTDFIAIYITPIAVSLRSRTRRKVRFFDLWHVFQPGDTIVRRQDSSKSTILALQVLKTYGGRRQTLPKNLGPKSMLSAAPQMAQNSFGGVSPFIIDAFFLDFDGSSLVPVGRRFSIDPFQDEMNVERLAAYPIEYANSNVEEILLERGKRFVAVLRPKFGAHMFCEGSDLETGEDIDSEVVVDPRWYFLKAQDRIPTFVQPKTMDISELNEYVPAETIIRTQMRHLGDHESDLLSSDYLICHYRLHVFSLRHHKWAMTSVDQVKQIITMDDPLDHLILPAKNIQLLRSMVEEHARARNTSTEVYKSSDVIREKQRGLVILLHGAPGTGKTLTAECLAAHIRRPLYPITCGDLGTNPLDVERNLEAHFSSASRWGCVCLLDDADIYMERRQSANYQQNSLVAVFLRRLEYYQGILILTTNRVGVFDEAFRSRVHMTLHYTPMSEDTSIEIWKSLMKRASSTRFVFNKRRILRFARELFQKQGAGARWNGRQIRNAFQTALAVAEFEARDLPRLSDDHRIEVRAEHFELIAQSENKFQEYMRDILYDDPIIQDWKPTRFQQGAEKREKEKRSNSSPASESDSVSDSLAVPSTPTSV